MARTPDEAEARCLGGRSSSNSALRAEHRAGAALADLNRVAQADCDVHPDVTVADLYLLFAPTDRPVRD